MVQRDQRALALPTIPTKCGRIRAPRQRRPEPMHRLRERLGQRTSDIIEERGIRLEPGQRQGLELEPLACEIILDKVDRLAECCPAGDVLEIIQDGLGVFARWL